MSYTSMTVPYYYDFFIREHLFKFFVDDKLTKLHNTSGERIKKNFMRVDLNGMQESSKKIHQPTHKLYV